MAFLFVARGQVTIKVFVAFRETVPFIVKPDLLLARQLKTAWDQIAEDLQLQDGAFSLTLLKGTDGLLSFEENREEEEHYRHALKLAFENALHGFLQMKQKEGAVLQDDILARLEKIRKEMQLIESKSPLPRHAIEKN